MTRITKAPDERRRELIACAQKLFYTKGYESTSVGDIVVEVGVAKGTFYYYFHSKQAILEALVKELTEQSAALLHSIVADETLPVLAKWERAFRVVADWTTAQRAEMLAILRVMQKDENFLLQYKLRTQSVQTMAPEVGRIISQGVEEGVFETECVEDSAEIVLAIMHTLYDTCVEVLLNPGDNNRPAELARRKIRSVETAIERVLGAQPGSLSLIGEQTFAAWFQDRKETTVEDCR